MPSLQQLNEAISSYRADHPDVLITVVVDATFGHRIDPKEAPEFERSIETNAFVAPPAGAVGRGDGFILNIAQKANASILSNDSYQEFHGEFAWLFDEGRLIGGKPVPHVGWVFVNRVPVRGPVSRRSVKEQKIVEKSPSRGRGRARSAESTPSISADGPMPIPKAPPPGAVLPGMKTDVAGSVDAVDEAKPKSSRSGRGRGRGRSSEGRGADEQRTDGRNGANGGRNGDGRNRDGGDESQQSDEARNQPQKSANDLLAFLSFVEHYPVGTAVTAVVENYSSHGAYVAIGEAKGYVPLRLMAEPAPRSARDVMAIGESVTLIVAAFTPAKRSIDLAVPAMAPVLVPAAVPKPRKSAAKKAVADGTVTKKAGRSRTPAVVVPETAAVISEAIAVAAAEVKPMKATRKRASATRTSAPETPGITDAVQPAAVVAPVADEPVAAPAKASRGRAKKAAGATIGAPAAQAGAKAGAKKAPAKAAATAAATVAPSPVVADPLADPPADATPAKSSPNRRRRPAKSAGA